MSRQTRITASWVVALVGIGMPWALAAAERAPVADQLAPLSLSDVRLGGSGGHTLDRLIQARYASDFARQEIYPEAAEALRQRVDGTMLGGRGFWQGEFWGKWMLGALAAQRYTGDPALKQFLRQAVREAIATQDASGYIGTYSKTDTVTGWNVWCMKYTLWALLEAHEAFNDPESLAAAQRQADYLMTFVGPGKAEIAKTGNFEGLPSASVLQPLLSLYRHTGEQRYLDYAQYIARQLPGVMTKGLKGEPVHTWFPQPEKWAKAYEFIHCVEGLVELYRVTGAADYRTAAQNIADDLMKHERTLVGNVGMDDKLNHARLHPDAYSEVCDAVYYLRLCANLLRLTGDAAYAQEMERTFYNSLCGAMNREGTWGVRRLALKAPHLTSAKHCWLEQHQCCVANAPRGFLQMAEYAVMTSRGGVTVNFYVPGTFKAALPGGGELAVAMQTEYPENGRVTLLVTPARAQAFPLALRIPDWSAQTAVAVNGAPLKGVRPSGYFTIDRDWAAGDRVELVFDLRGRLTRFPDEQQAFVAVERGPVVLAQDSLLPEASLGGAVDVKADKEGYVELQACPQAKGFGLVFRVPLSGGGAIAMCDYSSVGEEYKQQIADYYGPPKPGKRVSAPVANVLPAGAEDFRVWLRVKNVNAEK